MGFEIITTETLGFCFGVDRAVAALYDRIEKEKRVGSGRKIYTFGPIIHNPDLNEDLRQKGVCVIDDPEQADPNGIVFIRTHGVPRSVIEGLESRGVETVDMTCPKVKRIQKIAAGKKDLIIVGDIAHPEVVGIVGNAENSYFIAKSLDELKNILHNKLNNRKQYVLVVQTTFNIEEFERMSEYAKAFPNVEVVNTICTATHDRQRQVEELSEKVDAMIIVGGKNSSNTKKLYEIAKKNCDAFHIENFTQLPTYLGKYKKIGLSAGASTHRSAIEEVIINMVNENDEKVFTEDGEDFASLVEASLRPMKNGQKVTGTVTAVGGTEVQVDLCAKHSGFIPAEEFEHDDKPVAVGDEVEAVVVKVNDAEGTVLLSKSKLDAEKGRERIAELKESGEIVTGKVIQVVKGGLVVLVNKVRVFVPASLASLRRTEDLTPFEGTNVKLRIIEVEENGRRSRIIGSIKSVLKEEKEAAQKEIWDNIEVGKRYTGTVKSLTTFGAFVDIGGVDGLVHITDLSWGRIKHPSEVVNVGDVIEVGVKSYNPETKKVSLTYKKTEDDPWVILPKKYQVGDAVEVKVLKFMPYGAFVSVIPGIDGLIHISQLANHRVENVSDVLQIGQTVTAQITDINFETKKVSLSVKALLPSEDEAEEEDAPEEYTAEPASEDADE